MFQDLFSQNFGLIRFGYPPLLTESVVEFSPFDFFDSCIDGQHALDQIPLTVSVAVRDRRYMGDTVFAEGFGVNDDLWRVFTDVFRKFPYQAVGVVVDVFHTSVSPPPESKCYIASPRTLLEQIKQVGFGHGAGNKDHRTDTFHLASCRVVPRREHRLPSDAFGLARIRQQLAAQLFRSGLLAVNQTLKF